MNPKTTLALFVLLIIMLISGGCRNTTISTDIDHIESWITENPDSCLKYFIGTYPSLYRQKKFQEMELLYSHILHSMPDQPKGSKNLNYLVRNLLSYYHNALVHQDNVAGSEWLIDSLLNSSNPYYTQTMRPDLLAISAKLQLAQNGIEQIDSLGYLYLALPPVDDPRRNARNCYDIAWSLEYGEMDYDIPIRLMEQAIAFCQKANGEVDDEGEIYSYMGYLYWKNGELEKATFYIQQAIDWYSAHPDTPQEGLIETYSNLSRLNVSLRLFDKAIEANAQAVEISKSLDNWTLEEVYRMRAVCFEKAGNADSALFYVQKAIEITPEKSESYYIPNLRIDELGYYFSLYPDSLSGWLEECHQLLKDTALVNFERKNNLLAYYGMALAQTPGREREGVNYLEQCFHNFQNEEYPEGILFAGDELIRAYIRAGLPERISQVFILYSETQDSLQHEDNVNASIGANIRYETGRKEQENRVLSAEISLKQQTLYFTWSLVGLLALSLIAGGVYLHQRHRYLRQISEARLSQISGLLQKTSHELQKTTHELTEVSSQLDVLSKQKAVSDIRVKISTELFNSDKEAEFRRNFTAIHPSYLLSLHRLSPSMTRTDELIAMLLLLDLSNQEIALTLGISKSGVIKARSRMRQRLGLSSEMVLEEFLKNIPHY